MDPSDTFLIFFFLKIVSILGLVWETCLIYLLISLDSFTCLIFLGKSQVFYMKFLTVASPENLYILSIEVEMEREEVIEPRLKP